MSCPRFARMLVKFCQQRATVVLSPRDAGHFQTYVLDLLATRTPPLRAGRNYDWLTIAEACGVDRIDLERSARVLAPGLDALGRKLAEQGRSAPMKSENSATRRIPRIVSNTTAPVADEKSALPPRKCGSGAKPIVEFPESDGEAWTDPACFAEALDLHMRRHGDNGKHLARALANGASHIDATTINMWRRGVKVPRASSSLAAMELIERRYRLPRGYFQGKLPNTNCCTSAGAIDGVSRAERRRLAWHLPVDFDRRQRQAREEILEWVQTVVISGSTDYRRFQAAAMKHRYSIRFPGLLGESTRPRGPYRFCRNEDGALLDPDLTVAAVDAPPQLAQEMADLVHFKTSTLTAFGYQRSGVWRTHERRSRVQLVAGYGQPDLDLRV